LTNIFADSDTAPLNFVMICCAAVTAVNFLCYFRCCKGASAKVRVVSVYATLIS
jgi:hypothetical protein